MLLESYKYYVLIEVLRLLFSLVYKGPFLLHFNLFIEVGIHFTVYVWKSEDNLQELVLSFHSVGVGCQGHRLPG